jgi:hypothetical protein
MRKKVVSLLSGNLKHYITYDYNTHYHCDDRCSDICRCSTISSVRVVAVHVPFLVEGIVPNAKNKMLRYGVDRILRHHKIYRTDIWDVHVVGGYYGQEIGSVTLDRDVALAVDRDIARYARLSAIKSQTEFLLQLEYGYLLDVLKDRRYRTQTVPLNQVRFGNEDYRKRVDSEMVEHYQSYPYFVGVVLQEDKNCFRLIDGYHRFTAATFANAKKVDVVVALQK